VCDSHGSDESLLLSVRSSGGSLSHGGVLLPLGGGDGLLLAGMIGKTVVVRGGGGWRRTLGLDQR
jgi:hypothetical protein